MTFKELETKFSSIIEADWHQHKNGGGWIYKDAKVNDDVFIHDSVVVWGGTIEGGTIWGGTIWGGTIRGGTIRGGTIEGGTIEGGTIWGGTIRGGTIRGGTIEGGTIEGGTIWGGTIRGGTIEGGTIWGGTIRGGTIEGGDWKKSPLFVMDSRSHGATNSKPGYLRIGCEIHTFKEWQKEFKQIAEKHNLNDDEKKEYKAIVNLFCEIGKAE